MEGEDALVALAILVFAALLATIVAVIALIRSGRIPGLGATCDRAVEVVAARIVASSVDAKRDATGGMETPARA